MRNTFESDQPATAPGLALFIVVTIGALASMFVLIALMLGVV